MTHLIPKRTAITFQKELSTKAVSTIPEKEVYELCEMLRLQRSGKGLMADIEHDVDEAWLPSITCPTLIIHSKNDASVSIDHAYHANKHIRNAKLVTLDNDWGHLIWIGCDSEKVFMEMESFLSSQIDTSMDA